MKIVRAKFAEKNYWKHTKYDLIFDRYTFANYY